MNENTKITDNRAAMHVIDDAVGVPFRKWFIAIVNHNNEKNCGERLLRLGYEAYVPTQTEQRLTRRGRHKTIDRIVLPSMIFIRATEPERREVVKLPYIIRFMTNRLGMVNEFNRHPLAIVPADQIERLKFMLYNTDEPVCIESAPIQLGDKIRVIRGALQGLEGRVTICDDNNAYIIVLLDSIG
jgi:transcription antitermination factor NusG